MEFSRKRARIVVDIAVTLTTVLDSVDARIIDLSEHGAQIEGAAIPKGGKFQIEYEGQTVYAQCMWSEIDRMGVRFPFAISDGPLHDALTMAISTQQSRSADDVPVPRSGFMPPPGNFSNMAAGAPGRRMATASFGRRNAS